MNEQINEVTPVVALDGTQAIATPARVLTDAERQEAAAKVKAASEAPASNG